MVKKIILFLPYILQYICCVIKVADENYCTYHFLNKILTNESGSRSFSATLHPAKLVNRNNFIMRNTTYILNNKAVEWGLTLGEVYIFSWMYELPSWAKRTDIEGKSYYFASRNKAISDMPLVTDKTDTMYRYYQKLEQKGLIEVIKVAGQDYVALTDKAKTWNSSIRNSDLNPSDLPKEGQNSKNDVSNSDLNPNKLGNISETNSDLNPTNSIISNNSNINDNKKEKKENIFFTNYKESDKELTIDQKRKSKEKRIYQNGNIIELWFEWYYNIEDKNQYAHAIDFYVNDNTQFYSTELFRTFKEPETTKIYKGSNPNFIDKNLIFYSEEVFKKWTHKALTTYMNNAPECNLYSDYKNMVLVVANEIYDAEQAEDLRKYNLGEDEEI